MIRRHTFTLNTQSTHSIKLAINIIVALLGLLVLGPIVINILCFHGFVIKGGWSGVHAFITVAALFLLWTERRAFAGLVNRTDA